MAGRMAGGAVGACELALSPGLPLPSTPGIATLGVIQRLGLSFEAPRISPNKPCGGHPFWLQVGVQEKIPGWSPGRDLLLGCGWWPGVHTRLLCAPGRWKKAGSCSPVSPAPRAVHREAGRPWLICTLSASDRDASQVRTCHCPPWEGRNG